MAIQSKTAVETEYASKRDVILAYPAANLDDDLAKIDVLAIRVTECLAILRGREALNGRPTSTPTIERISEAAGQIGRASALIRGYVAEIKGCLGDVQP